MESRQTPNLAIDDVVIIQDNNMPPLKWKLSRVVDVHKGADDKIRVVTLKTANRICKRTITKLCNLSISDTDDSAI